MADRRRDVAADLQAIAGDRAILAGDLDVLEFPDRLPVDRKDDVAGVKGWLFGRRRSDGIARSTDAFRQGPAWPRRPYIHAS